MGTEQVASSGNDLAGPRPAQHPRHELRMLARRDKADLLAIGLVGRGQAEATGPCADLVFGELAHRQEHPAEPLTGHLKEHRGLVFATVAAAVQAVAPVGSRQQPGMMAGGHVAGTDGVGVVEEPAKLQPGVAADAGVGRAAAAILGSKVVDDAVEVVGEIERVERDAEPLRHPAGVEGIFHAAAALMAWPGGFQNREAATGCSCSGRPVPHKHADHLVARLHEHRRSDARVDPSAHRNDYP